MKRQINFGFCNFCVCLCSVKCSTQVEAFTIANLSEYLCLPRLQLFQFFWFFFYLEFNSFLVFLANISLWNWNVFEDFVNGRQTWKVKYKLSQLSSPCIQVESQTLFLQSYTFAFNLLNHVITKNVNKRNGGGQEKKNNRKEQCT